MFTAEHSFNKHKASNWRKLARVVLTIAVLASTTLTFAQSESFSRAVILEEARVLAGLPFSPPPAVPDALLALDYDQYRQIQYQKEAAVWGGTRTRFSIEMFAPGNLYNSGVEIFIVENGEAKIFPVETDTFTASSPDIVDLLAAVDKVAGFRLHYPLNTTEYEDEFIVFQGASYFRAVSKGQNYGLSARGLALDVAEPTGEEFPIFRKFWIERPSSRSDSIVVHALLDSPRVSGAYRFGIYPDDPTRMDVEATLFTRETLTHIGLGPLTSMYTFGSMDSPDVPDYRAAVHDSNGLAILTGQDEYLWRPLQNPNTLQVSYFGDTNPKGFGLAQRNRKLEDFQDLEAQYQRRPSAWVSTRGSWGPGSVVLVEIPTRSETNDNIVAYWRPRLPLLAGSEFSFAYQLSWPDDSPLPAESARIVRTAYGFKLATTNPQFVIDYAYLADGIVMEELTIDASTSNGSVLETLVNQSGPNSVRLFVTIDPEGASLSEIRVQPKYRGNVVGETMLFRWIER
jgi:periplasmic glucans biosynthesis protein